MTSPFYPFSPYRSLAHWILQKLGGVLLQLESCCNFLYSSTLPVFFATAWKHNRIMESTRGNGMERWIPGVDAQWGRLAVWSISSCTRSLDPIIPGVSKKSRKSIPYFLLATILIIAVLGFFSLPRRGFVLLFPSFTDADVYNFSIIICTLLQISATL